MNILDSAYRIGQQMKTISIGKEWIELYTQLSESISAEAWDTFLKMPRGLMHYYSFPYARDIIEENSKRNDLPEYLKDQMQELEASEPLKRFCELSVALGNNLNELIRSAMAPRPIPRDFGEFQASPKLSRSIQDIHRAFQRSGMLKGILRYMNPNTKEILTVVDTFTQEKNSFLYPLSRGIRKVVRNLGSTEQQQKLLSVMYISDLLFDITKQMVFESHLQRVVNIPSESIVRLSVKNVNGVRPMFLSLDVTMLSETNRTSHFITVRFGGVTQTAIMTRCRVRFGQVVPGGFKMSMKGYLYPESDVDLLHQLVE